MQANPWIGGLAALAAAVLGAGWQLASRYGVTTTLGPAELAWLRYALPALLLLPVLLRGGWPRVSWRLAAVLGATGGLPFGLLVLAGAQRAPAAHLGIFMAGSMPLFTALGCWLVLKEPVRGWRWAGLLLVAAGVLGLGASAWTGPEVSSWRGDLLFLAAAAIWALYTIALRRSDLGAWQAAAIVNGMSALALVVLLPWFAPARLFTAPWNDVLLQVVWQGILAGVLGLAAYTTAVAHLGPARASLSSALVPLLTALGAATLLNEALAPPTLFAGALVAAGIVLAGWSRPAVSSRG